MEKQMTAERTRRAVVTTAEGEKSSAILQAEAQAIQVVAEAIGTAGLASYGMKTSFCAQLLRAEAPSRARQRLEMWWVMKD
jgi:regulator of protease activity HflC (stomatin/prohibitin superfamily)